MPFACDMQGCEELFTSIKGKELHMNMHQAKSIYKCNIFSLKFDSSPELKNIRCLTQKKNPGNVTGVSYKDFQENLMLNTTNTCTVKSAKNTTLIAILGTVNYLVQRVICLMEVNLPKFTKPLQMSGKQEGKPLLKFTCSLCHSWFKERKDTVAHMCSVHKYNSIYSCLDCSFMFCNRQTLFEHKKGSNCKRVVHE